METIKTHSDIPQSKKLVEFLPLESADMYYEPSAGFRTEPSEVKFGDIEYAHPRSIRCWSLAALLDILEQVKEIKNQRVTILVDRYAGGHWYVELLKVQDERSVLFEHSKELVDACYEMVLKLHELKLL